MPIAMGATPHLIEQIVSILSQSATQAANAVSRAIAAQRESRTTNDSPNRDRRATTARKAGAAAATAANEAVDPDYDGPIVQRAARDFFEARANAGLVNLCETICRCLRNLCFSSDNAEKLARCERAPVLPRLARRPRPPLRRARRAPALRTLSPSPVYAPSAQRRRGRTARDAHAARQ